MAKANTIVSLLKKEHERLTKQLHGVSAALAAFGAAYSKKKKKTGTRKLSAAARARISKAQKARWAKVKTAKKTG